MCSPALMIVQPGHGGGGGGGGDKSIHLHKNISPIFFPSEISKSSTLMLPIRNTTNTNVDEKMDNKSKFTCFGIFACKNTNLANPIHTV